MTSYKIILFICCCVFSSNGFTQTCWKYFHADSCKNHIITEFSISTPILLSGDNFHRRIIDIAFNLGYTRQLNQKFGLGGHFFGNASLGNNSNVQFGFRPRLAWYFDKHLELNFSPGIILASSENFGNNIPGFSFESSFLSKQLFNVVSRLDWLKGRDSKGGTVRLHLGVKTKGRTGLVLGLAAPAVSFLFLFLGLSASR